MRTRPVIFHPAVEKDLESVLGYYGERDSALPARFRARLKEQVERIEAYPDSGPILFDSYQRVPLKRFPYMAVYLVHEDHIDVLAVISMRRDPSHIEAVVAARDADT